MPAGNPIIRGSSKHSRIAPLICVRLEIGSGNMGGCVTETVSIRKSDQSSILHAVPAASIA